MKTEMKAHIKQEGNSFDKLLKENGEIVFLPMAENLLNFGIETADFQPTKMQTTYEREVDGAYWVKTKDGEHFILHFEYQSTDDHDLVKRMNEYAAMLRCRYDDIVNVKSLVIYVGERPATMRTELRAEEIFKGFYLLQIRDQPVEPFLESKIPEAVIMAILARYPKTEAESILTQIVERLKSLSKTNSDLVKYSNQLLMFSQLRNLEAETAKILNLMPIHIDLSKSTLYKKGAEQERIKMEQEFLAEKKSIVIHFLENKLASLKKIAEIVNVPIKFVRQVKKEIEN